MIKYLKFFSENDMHTDYHCFTDRNIISMQHTIVGPILENCGVTVDQRSEMSALSVVPQLIICQQWPPVGPPRIYCSHTNLLPPTIAQKFIFYWSNSVLKLLELCLLIIDMPTHHSPMVSQFTNDGPTICATWVFIDKLHSISDSLCILYASKRTKLIYIVQIHCKLNIVNADV